MHSNGRAHTNTFSRHRRSRRWKTVLFFHEQIAVLCWRVRLHLHVHTHAHMHTGLMRAGIASGLTFLLPCSPWQLWSFLFMHSQQQRGRRDGEGEMREAWIQLLLCIHSPTSSWIPLTGVCDTGVFLCKSSSRICVLVVDAYIRHRITSIKWSAYSFLLFACVFFFLLLKDRRILNCVCGWETKSVFALSQPSDPEIMMASKSPSKGTIQWRRLPQEIKAPSSLSCAFRPNRLPSPSSYIHFFMTLATLKTKSSGL